MKYRIMVVEDHPIYLEGLTMFINEQSDLIVCGKTDNAADAMTELEKSEPHLVIVDLVLAGSSGFYLVQNIRSKWPDLKILILTMYDETRFANRLLQEGVSGYIMKDEGPENVLRAIRTILAGDTYASETIKQQILSRGTVDSPEFDLSNKELEIFQLLGEGSSVADIARILCRSPKTIQNQAHRMEGKLGNISRQALYQLARDRVRSRVMPRFPRPSETQE